MSRKSRSNRGSATPTHCDPSIHRLPTRGGLARVRIASSTHMQPTAVLLIMLVISGTESAPHGWSLVPIFIANTRLNSARRMRLACFQRSALSPNVRLAFTSPPSHPLLSTDLEESSRSHFTDPRLCSVHYVQEPVGRYQYSIREPLGLGR